jgi:hypothetical protein
MLIDRCIIPDTAIQSLESIFVTQPPYAPVTTCTWKVALDPPELRFLAVRKAIYDQTGSRMYMHINAFEDIHCQVYTALDR